MTHKRRPHHHGFEVTRDKWRQDQRTSERNNESERPFHQGSPGNLHLRLFLSAPNEILPGFDANELHFSRLRPSERADQKITEQRSILVHLTLNVLGNITVTSDQETLL